VWEVTNVVVVKINAIKTTTRISEGFIIGLNKSVRAGEGGRKTWEVLRK
jgi:hypothetical protein